MCVYVQSLSHVQLFVTPWTIVHQFPLLMEFPRTDSSQARILEWIAISHSRGSS